MCFSATASFTAAAALGVVGVATLRKAKTASELPLACTPLLFGTQQLVEGGVWLSFSHPGLASLNGAATYVYSLFSHLLWPVYVPFAVFCVEPDPRRRRLLAPLLALGGLLSTYLLYFIIVDPVTSEVVNDSVRYEYHHHYPGPSMFLYLFCVCVGSGLSTFGLLRLLGVGLAVGFAAAYVLYTLTFFSVWCFFGAALSLLLYLHFRRLRHAEQFAHASH